MSSHYHDPTDMDLLSEVRKSAPREFAAWMQLDQVVGIEDGAIPLKYRELIAIACAHVTQCVYCIEEHVGAAKRAGVSRDELAEAALLAAALRAGGAGAHSALAMKLYDSATPAEPQ
ncbi:carboxymuconolactone decarboxylase family protein [Leekyejoonella antrihumi]|uniref:Carboxymuconolactone decarboxylase family protein n=1 Tax=Leekyejoonella antrihumi TaxID=1660198 RepID=A0A563E9L7_9MICO|nr:carboxymuconolactone decarboxylase family protein [Leekyejoonella antrihumi]TWP38494.1 carboxymuconolactone decarboxylase family protein [Leekyejoonella antrihumi]